MSTDYMTLDNNREVQLTCAHNWVDMSDNEEEQECVNCMYIMRESDCTHDWLIIEDMCICTICNREGTK